MTTTKINLPKQMIKDLGLDLSNQKIQMLERKVEFHKKAYEDTLLKLGREYDRAKKTNKTNLSYLDINIWK